MVLDKVQMIRRNWDNTPTIFSDEINENCNFENTLIEGWGTIILDKDYLDEINELTDKYEVSKNLVSMLTEVTNIVIDYFFSNEKNDKNRKETYGSDYVTEDGLIIGTKMSSLKGKNIAECSEKSITGYIILNKLYKEGKIKSKPSLILSTLGSESIEEGPHAFILIDREHNDFPTKHLLFDIHNPSQIEVDGEVHNMVGLYALTDDQYNDLISGDKITPQSLFEFASSDYKDVGEKRIYGSKNKNMIK